MSEPDSEERESLSSEGEVARFEFHHGRALWCLLIAYLIIRVPWMVAGFGRDGDDWRIALTARYLLNTGFYLPSRSLGYPVVELGIVPFIHFGWFLPNLATTVVSFFGILSLSRILSRNRVPNHHLIIIAWAFFPVALDYSASTSDFMWAISFVLMAWDAADDKRSIPFFIFMALAIGSRPTIGLFVFPFAYFLIRDAENKWKSYISACVIPCILAALVYIPVRLKKSILDVVLVLDDLGRFSPEQLHPIRSTFYAIGEYGLLTSLSLSISLVLSFRWFLKNRPTGGFARDTWIVLISQIPLIIHHLPYLDKVGYLLPAVLPVLLIGLSHIPRRVCIVVVIVILLEGMVTFHPTALFDDDERLFDKGYPLRRLDERNDFVDIVTEVESMELNDTVFILGWQHITFRWAETNLYDCKALSPCQELPQFGSEDRDVHGPTYDASRNNSYHSVLNQNEIEQVLRLNYSIVYSEAGYSMTLGQHGIDLSQVDGARMLE